MFAKAITTYEPEHRAMLRANTADFVSARPLSTIRTLNDNRSFSSEVFAEMAALGWLGIEAASGGELDACDMAALHRELGRGVTPEPVIASGVLAADLLGRSDNPAIQARFAQVCDGTAIATLAWQGQAHALTSADCGANAQRVAGGWRIDGDLRFVAWASKADALLVAARSPEGVIVAWVPADDANVSIRRGTGIDMSELAAVTLSGVFVADADVVTTPEHGAAQLDDALDRARLAASAELVGAAEGVFAMTLDYLRQRKQFGKAIGANQAVQFVCTDLFVQIELANSVLAAAAAKMADGVADRALAVAGCKARCGDAALFAAKQAIQLHGAIGYTHECDVSLFVRRIMQLNAWLGNPAIQRQRIARERSQIRLAAA